MSGENHHVAPVHPDYAPLPPLKRDVEGAKKLLKEAGFPNGLEVTIDVGNTDGPWHQTACEAMRDQLKEAGINLKINVMPAAKYWEIWDKTPFGCTAWTHRPLGTMVMSLGYRTGVPWNESRYANPEFDKALDAAEATLDVAARKVKLAVAAKILQDDCGDGDADLAAGLHDRGQERERLPRAPDGISSVQQDLAELRGQSRAGEWQDRARHLFCRAASASRL